MYGNTGLLVSTFTDLMRKHQEQEAFHTLREIKSVTPQQINSITNAFTGKHNLTADDKPEDELDRLNIPYVNFNLDGLLLYSEELRSLIHRRFIDRIRLRGDLKQVASSRIKEGEYRQVASDFTFIMRGSSSKGTPREPFSISSSHKVDVQFTTKTKYESRDRTISNLQFIFFPNIGGRDFLWTECTADVEVNSQGRMKLLTSPYLCKIYH